jgi:hypothetical protein
MHSYQDQFVRSEAFIEPFSFNIWNLRLDAGPVVQQPPTRSRVAGEKRSLRTTQITLPFPGVAPVQRPPSRISPPATAPPPSTPARGVLSKPGAFEDPQRLDRAATAIAAAWRMYRQRRVFLRLRVLSAAAGRIQDAWRSHAARKATWRATQAVRGRRQREWHERQAAFHRAWPGITQRRRCVCPGGVEWSGPHHV